MGRADLARGPASGWHSHPRRRRDRLYRGSREDALFSATADPGVTVNKELTLDVLAGERIYITMDGGAVTQAGVQMFIVGDMATFPSTCQIAVAFDAATGNTVDNLCGADFTYHNYDTSTDIPPTLAAGPYTEAGMASSIQTAKYFDAPNPLDRTGDFTIQFWVKFMGVVDVDTGGWAFSDLDLNVGGGIGMVLYTDQMVNHLATEISSCTDASGSTLLFDTIDAQYPEDAGWHFVRIAHSGTDIAFCLDGAKLGNKTFTHPLASTFAPYLGKNVVWTPSELAHIRCTPSVRPGSALPHHRCSRSRKSRIVWPILERDVREVQRAGVDDGVSGRSVDRAIDGIAAAGGNDD